MRDRPRYVVFALSLLKMGARLPELIAEHLGCCERNARAAEEALTIPLNLYLEGMPF